MSGAEAFALATGAMTVINFTTDTGKVFKSQGAEPPGKSSLFLPPALNSNIIPSSFACPLGRFTAH